MLPSSYGYYNVPYQYRSVYPTRRLWLLVCARRDLPVRPVISLITSVAALMSPGLTIGQPLPMGYGMYNVPYGYRTTYFDTANDWYRYNNGYIYGSIRPPRSFRRSSHRS